MKDIKRQQARFSFYDHTHIERHLERMAQKGWMLEKMGDYRWTYRRCEPRKLRFSVCYAPKASTFDPGLTDGQKEFIDFCERTGWRFAASNAKLQAFCNEADEPVPIHTDPAMELASLHQAAKSSYFLPCGLILALALWRLLELTGRLLRDPVGVLANTGVLMQLGSWSWMLVYFGVDLAAYFLWRRRAKRAAERGVFLETPNTAPFLRAMSALLSAELLLWALDLAFAGDGRMIGAVLASALYTVVLIAGVLVIKNVLKRKGVSREKNRAATIAADVILAFGGMALLVSFILRASDGEHHGGEARDTPALAMSELFDVDDENYYYGRSDSATLLLSCSDLHCGINYHDWSEYHREPPGSIPTGYECTVVDVRAAFLRDFCRDALMRRQGRSAAQMEIERYGRWRLGLSKSDEGVAYETVDPAPWGADEAWRIRAGEEEWRHWLLRYGGRFVDLGLDWEPTTAQMNTIGETLGG